MSQSTETPAPETAQPSDTVRARVWLFLAEKFSWSPTEMAKIPEGVFVELCEELSKWPSRRVPELDIDEDAFDRAVRHSVNRYLNESARGPR